MGGVLSYLLGGEAESEIPPTESSSSGPIVVHSSAQWGLHFNATKELNKLVVVDFAASWCGPCKLMEPFVKSLADKYTDVNFIKIDVDELQDVAQEFAVQAMPTFVLLKQGKVVGRVVGAKKEELEKMIKVKREVPKFAA